MPGRQSEKTYEVTWLIRRVFRAMGTAAEAYLAESGITAAERAVLEFLYPDKRNSVPEIAKRYDVSRQHIQVTVNALLDRDLLRREDNPQHKRSPLIRLSRSGRDTFAEVRRIESGLIDSIFADVDDAELASTLRALRKIYNTLQQRREL